VAQREHLRRVRERHGALAGGVERGEEEDEHGDEAEVRLAPLRDVERETRGEERPRHVGEGEEEEGAPPVGVDGADRGEGEAAGRGEVSESKTETGGAYTKLTTPKPKEARSADFCEEPACTKTVDE
jgi:hypothetical protein